MKKIIICLLFSTIFNKSVFTDDETKLVAFASLEAIYGYQQTGSVFGYGFALNNITSLDIHIECLFALPYKRFSIGFKNSFYIFENIELEHRFDYSNLRNELFRSAYGVGLGPRFFFNDMKNQWVSIVLGYTLLSQENYQSDETKFYFSLSTTFTGDNMISLK